MEWKDLDFFRSSKFTEINNYLNVEISKGTKILPVPENIYNAMHMTPLDDVKVVILGQDPYPSGGHAHGLAFSSLQEKLPASLKNIFQELEKDLGIKRTNGCLYEWAAQGILLLNTVLTVEEGRPNSHRGLGWESLTDEIIKTVNGYHKFGIVFVLWGKQAQAKKSLMDTSKHNIIESSHPSPQSVYRGFFGSKPFSKINACLQQTIDW